MKPEDRVATRLARYAVTHDARDLWPEVSVAAFRACQGEIARVASAVLAEPVAPVSLRLPPGADARALGVAAMAAGMGPLLGYWVEVGQVRAEHALAELLALHLEHGRRRAVRMRAELERVLVPLGERGVEVVVLKGLDTAYRYFPDPGTRPTADIDLLVGPGDRAQAERVLEELGFAREGYGPRERGHWLPPVPGAVRSLELAQADDPWHVDLHWSLDRVVAPGIVASVGRVEPALCDPHVIIPATARVLPPGVLLAHLAAHASSHFHVISLIRLVELVLVVRREFRGSPDRWGEFTALLEDRGAQRFCYPALHLVEKLAPGTVDPVILESLRAAAPRRLRERVQGRTPGSAQELHPLPSGKALVWVATPKDAASVLLGALWPDYGSGPLPLRQALAIHRRRLVYGWRRLFGVRVPH